MFVCMADHCFVTLTTVALFSCLSLAVASVNLRRTGHKKDVLARETGQHHDLLSILEHSHHSSPHLLQDVTPPVLAGKSVSEKAGDKLRTSKDDGKQFDQNRQRLPGVSPLTSNKPRFHHRLQKREYFHSRCCYVDVLCSRGCRRPLVEWTRRRRRAAQLRVGSHTSPDSAEGLKTNRRTATGADKARSDKDIVSQLTASLNMVPAADFFDRRHVVKTQGHGIHQRTKAQAKQGSQNEAKWPRDQSKETFPVGRLQMWRSMAKVLDSLEYIGEDLTRLER